MKRSQQPSAGPDLTITLVQLPGYAKPPPMGDNLHAMQFRAAPSSQVEPPPSLTASPSDRDYPLDTAGDHCLVGREGGAAAGG